MALRCCFRCVYGIYNSRIGRWFHNCMIKNRHERRIRSKLGIEHSRVDKEVLDFSSFKVKIVPLGRTNYSYFIQDTSTGYLGVVDPGDPDYLTSVADKFFKKPISVVLLTHKHWDHSAGILKLSKVYPGLQVYASKEETAFEVTHTVSDNEIIHLGQTHIRTINTPVHTKGSVCFFIESERAQPVVFTGDTFFLGGMGAFFEGDIKSACASVSKVISLPNETLMFPGHEYSDTTMKFALYLQPQNEAVKRKVSWIVKRRARYMVTIPSTIKEEKSYNPFFRIYDPNFITMIGARFYLEAIAKIQEMRMRKRNEYRNLELKIYPRID